jgi:hypothetical protein
MNFAVHVAIFLLINSGLWFFRILGETSELNTIAGLPWTPWITVGWGAILLAHAIFIFAIAKYESPLSAPVTDSGVGFQPKTEKKAAKTKR